MKTQKRRLSIKQKKLLNTRIDDCGLGIRIKKCFKELGFITIADALKHTIQELKHKHYLLGDVSVSAWESFVDMHGLR